MRPRHLPGWVAFAVALLLVLCVSRRASASIPPTRVSVLTMGPGDHPFTRFGHNALLLQWDGAGAGSDAVFNYGTFEFDGVKGAEDFMAGRFRYWLSVGTLEGTLRAYSAEKRSLSAQELELNRAERAELFAALVENALPEHRYYDYDYYRDNCSTRVRDVLDRLLKGELRRSVTGAGHLTFRQHTLRLVGDTPWLYAGLDLALGAPTDQPTTRWEELFLPRELHDALSHATRQLGDRRVPLVRAEHQLLEASRLPQPPRPPERRPAYAALGCLLGAAAAALGGAAGRRRLWRAVFGISTAFVGGGLGLLGTTLGVFSASKHWAAHQNWSLLACPPWALGLVVLGVAFALGKPKSARRLQLILGAALAASVLLLIASLFHAHEAERVALFFMPLWAGWFWGARSASAAVLTDRAV